MVPCGIRKVPFCLLLPKCFFKGKQGSPFLELEACHFGNPDRVCCPYFPKTHMWKCQRHFGFCNVELLCSRGVRRHFLASDDNRRVRERFFFKESCKQALKISDELEISFGRHDRSAISLLLKIVCKV